MGEKVRTPILMAGFGWIGAGMVNLFTWYIIYTRGIPSGNPDASLLLSVLVFAVGISVLVLRRKINNIIDEKTRRSGSRGSGKDAGASALEEGVDSKGNN
ncbi:MAG: hypothetical protein QXN59_02630 [Candidatus Micrarchaeaceae archaeon]